MITVSATTVGEYNWYHARKCQILTSLDNYEEVKSSKTYGITRDHKFFL
jgi:hypothetical protein